MDSYYSILSYDGRNPDIINRGGEAARYLRAELEAAKQEAKNMCSKENKRCCSKVIIIVSDSGDKNGKGAWQVKFTFGINPYTVICLLYTSDAADEL